MASDRPDQTLADYIALAISPALLMGLVGSLVFFLLEILYPDKGAYKDRLQWILFFFVFGAVLAAHLSHARSRRACRIVRLGACRPHLDRHANLRRLP